MNEYKVICTIYTKTADKAKSYNTIEAAKSDIISTVSEMAETNGINGDFVLNVTIEKNGEYYDSDEAAANYTNGVLTIEV